MTPVADTKVGATVVTAVGAGASLVIRATPASGAYKFTPQSDDDWAFVRTA